MTVYVTGNSHIRALRLGLESLGLANGGVEAFAFGNGKHEVTRFAERVGDRVVMLNTEYAERLTSHTGSACIGSEHVWVIVMGTHNLRILRGSMWLDNTPSALGFKGKRPISNAVLNRIIDNDQKYIRDFLAALEGIGTRFIVASCPPLRRDRVVDHFGVDPEIAAFVNEKALSSFRCWLEEHDIEFVPPPESTKDQDGFLKPEFAAQKTWTGKVDKAHANSAYGELMITDILETVKSRFPEELLPERSSPDSVVQ